MISLVVQHQATVNRGDQELVGPINDPCVKRYAGGQQVHGRRAEQILCIGIHYDGDAVNGRESEEPPQMEVLGKGMLEQIDKLNINKFSAPDGVYPGVLKKHTPQIRNF